MPDPLLELTRCMQLMRNSKPSDVDTLSIFPVNHVVLSALPCNVKSFRTNPHGSCNDWFYTGCITVETVENETYRFFVKYGAGPLAHGQLRSEFQSLTRLYTSLPDSVPKPHAFKNLELGQSEEAYYLMTDFVEFLDSGLPDTVATAKLVAQLHQQGFSKAALFGSDIDVFDGIFRISASSHTSWTSCFEKILSECFEHDRSANGVWPELEEAFHRIKQIVIPRLLGPLSEGKNPIRPCFIHGDIWEGNIGTEVADGKLFLFDSNGYFAHHEMDLAMWVTKHHSMHTGDYVTEYLRIVPATTPAHEFHDRVALYSLKPYITHSAHCREISVRKTVLQCMHRLINKFAPLQPHLLSSGIAANAVSR